MKRTMTAAEAIVRCLEIEEVSQAFCVPGESYLPIMDALYEHSDIRLIATRHESGAAFMAEGYAKTSGKPAVVMATRGVGAANLSIGVHTAKQDSTPMIVFLGQVHSKFRGREGFQEVDLDRFFAPIAKWAVEIQDPERIPELVQRAFRIATTGRPGPVVIAFPEDVLTAEITVDFAPAVRPYPNAPNQEAIDAAISLLEQAERPLILAGGGVKQAGGEEALLALSEAFAMPVVAAFRRHDVFPNDHQNYVGHAGLGPASAIIETMRSADVIVAIGTRLSEVTTQDYSIPGDGQKLIHIDIDSEVVGKTWQPAVGMVADAKLALESLQTQGITRIVRKPWKKWKAERRAAYQIASDPGNGDTADHPAGCNMRAVVRAMSELLPPDTIIANDAGNFAGWLHAFYQFREKKTYVGPTSGAMGYGYPAALGAKLAAPERLVVSLSGDGGFMMTMQELETAARCRIPVIALVFNNAMYGTIRMHQEKHYPGRVVATDLGAVDFAAVAKALNIESYHVDSTADFRATLARIVQTPVSEPVLIEVKVDPNVISVGATIESIRKTVLK
ncbi:thiamine pyrophosphate-dependent enzyme [Camelliibacillus cellulosilyticus]|uniref:Thiamine pyrophosphate-dependent enzyme n=1 Tax=Camelliibacillus cellulosilyticus TaxID=2174486 RepID=A0ABV9GK34_9BACL